MQLTLENLQPSGGTNTDPACITLAYKADDLGAYPITSVQFHMVFTNATHGTVTGPVTQVSLTAHGTGATGFGSCSLGLSTYKFYFSGTVTYWSSALPGRYGTLALPSKYSLNPYS